MNKKAESALGEMVEMIPQLIILTIIAVSVFSAAAVFYPYDISVRDVEARLLGRVAMDCLAKDGVVNLDAIDVKKYGSILSYCGVSVGERGYVGVDVSWNGDKVEMSEGDSGALWVRDLFEKAVLTGNAVSGVNSESVEKIVKYNPGYFSSEYPTFVFEDGKKYEGKVKLEVLIKYEDE